jgi:hypothetical protein
MDIKDGLPKWDEHEDESILIPEILEEDSLAVL